MNPCRILDYCFGFCEPLVSPAELNLWAVLFWYPQSLWFLHSFSPFFCEVPRTPPNVWLVDLCTGSHQLWKETSLMTTALGIDLGVY